MVSNQQAKEETEAVGDAATAILAYLDMGKEKEVERIIRTMDRRHLGMVINTWYQLGVAHRGRTITASIANRTIEFFVQKAADASSDRTDRTSAAFAKELLNRLANNKIDQYARTWKAVIDYQPDITTEVAALLLGFTRGILADIPTQEEGEG